MARLELVGTPVVLGEIITWDANRPLSATIDAWDGGGSYTALDIAIKRVDRATITVMGIETEVQTVVLAPGEDAKLPHLPVGVCWHSCEDEGCRAVTMDVRYYLNTIGGLMAEHCTSYTWEQVRAVFRAFRYREMETRITPQFDIHSEVDQRTTFSEDGYDTFLAQAYSSLTPWTPLRVIDMDYRLERDGVATLIEQYGASSGFVYANELDANLEGPATARFRRGFGTALHKDTGAEHQVRGRKLHLDADERVPFPEACRFDGLGATVLAFNIDLNGRYRKPEEGEFWRKDCVFIHRVGGYTRFLFWHHREMARMTGSTLKYVAILPAVVGDNECTRTMPVSPMRGMDPAVTRAVYGNPYFASALHHALNRRKFLMTKFPDNDLFPVYDVPDAPILIRADTDMRLRPGRHTKTGRKAVRNLQEQADQTTKVWLTTLPNSEFLFAETVQPVAQKEQPRRALMLDM